MFENEIAKYHSLNQIAESDGVVVFGGSDDINIPLGELKQAFALSDNIYNRSFAGLTAKAAAGIFDECIASLSPDTVLLHIGDADISDFENTEKEFEAGYRALIKAIKAKNKSCRIVIVSLKNYGHNATVAKMNRLLTEIARTENCEFEDICAKREWNARESSEVTSFLYNIGFDRPLNIKRPVYDLVRILFCYEG